MRHRRAKPADPGELRALFPGLIEAITEVRTVLALTFSRAASVSVRGSRPLAVPSRRRIHGGNHYRAQRLSQTRPAL